VMGNCLEVSNLNHIFIKLDYLIVFYLVAMQDEW
jgi:hypothetical protein